MTVAKVAGWSICERVGNVTCKERVKTERDKGGEWQTHGLHAGIFHYQDHHSTTITASIIFL